MKDNAKILVSKEDILSTYKDRLKGLKAIEKYKNWFPIRASPELAGIVADLIGDGHLQDNPKWRLDYTSKYKEELRRFGFEVYNLFKVKGKIRACKANKFSKTFNYGVNCKPLARILKLCGVPTEDKILKEFKTPKWILKDEKCFKQFISRLFSCEASVDTNKNNPAIGIDMWKRIELLPNGIEFFKEIKDYMYKYFNIISTNVFTRKLPLKKRKDGIETNCFRLKIKRKDSLRNFYDYIGFGDNSIKQNKLLKIINRNID